MDTVAAEYASTIEELSNWGDGKKVEDRASMDAVDAILKELKQYGTALGKAGQEYTAPHHSTWKASVAEVKTYTDDLAMMKQTCLDLVKSFKEKLAAEVAEKQFQANIAAVRARREAQDAQKALEDAEGDIEEKREAKAKLDEAKAATKAAASVKKEAVKGLRTVHYFKIDSHKAAFSDIVENDSDAVTAFIEDYVTMNHRKRPIDGVSTWTEKEAVR
jgi:hypothetical protein